MPTQHPACRVAGLEGHGGVAGEPVPRLRETRVRVHGVSRLLQGLHQGLKRGIGGSGIPVCRPLVSRDFHLLRWCDLVRCSVVWHGVVWCGVVWCVLWCVVSFNITVGAVLFRIMGGAAASPSSFGATFDMEA